LVNQHEVWLPHELAVYVELGDAVPQGGGPLEPRVHPLDHRGGHHCGRVAGGLKGQNALELQGEV